MSLARLRRAAQTIAQRFAVGGATWTISTPAGGLGGAPSSGGTIAGVVCQGRFGQQGTAAPGAVVVPLAWYFTATAGGTLAPGQQITDGTYRFTVLGIVAEPLGVYELERA